MFRKLWYFVVTKEVYSCVILNAHLNKRIKYDRILQRWRILSIMTRFIQNRLVEVFPIDSLPSNSRLHRLNPIIMHLSCILLQKLIIDEIASSQLWNMDLFLEIFSLFEQGVNIRFLPFDNWFETNVDWSVSYHHQLIGALSLSDYNLLSWIGSSVHFVSNGLIILRQKFIFSTVWREYHLQQLCSVLDILVAWKCHFVFLIWKHHKKTFFDCFYLVVEYRLGNFIR